MMHELSQNTQLGGHENTIHLETTDEERCQAVWEQLIEFVHVCDEHALDDEQTACAVLTVEAIAEQMTHGKTTIGGTVYDLIVGHRPINQRVSPRLLERLTALEILKRPTVMDGWSKTTKTQIARRPLWDLGTTAREYLDMQYLRGVPMPKENPGPHAPQHRTTDNKGDPNESIIHRYIVRTAAHYYTHCKQYQVRTYVKLGEIADVEPKYHDRRLDIVAFEDGAVVATGEAELHPLDTGGVTQDAETMALLPGDSDWWVFGQKQVNDLLHTFDGRLISRPSSIPGWDTREMARTEAIDRIQRIQNHSQGTIPEMASPIVTDVNTIDNLRAKLASTVPWIYEPLDPEGIEWAGGGPDGV